MRKIVDVSYSETDKTTYIQDNSGLRWVLGAGNTVSSFEDAEDVVSSKERVKQAIKLKEAGFTGDEVLELLK